MIKVTYYYSACVGVKTEDVSILCDPWFNDGAFDGSWYQYPKLKDPITTIGKYDYIYISHLHADHYDPQFLKIYKVAYPRTHIVIGDFKPNFLSKLLLSEGLDHTVLRSPRVIGETKFDIFVNDSRDFEIDTALAVERNGHSVVNMNDNRYTQPQVDAVRDFIGGDATIGLFSYAFGSGHPQTFYNPGDKRLVSAIDSKIKDGVGNFLRYNEAFGVKVSIPFAGKYFLGGKLLWALNPYRAVTDVTEMLKYADNVVVLADGGKAYIDTESLNPSAVRTESYDPIVSDVIYKTSHNKMDYERYFEKLPEKVIPFRRLISTAYDRALLKSTCEKDHYLCIRIPGEWAVLNTNPNNASLVFEQDIDGLKPRWEVYPDSKHLFGLLTGVFHWDNATVGSHYQTRRHPDEYDEDVQQFLFFFHV